MITTLLLVSVVLVATIIYLSRTNLDIRKQRDMCMRRMQRMDNQVKKLVEIVKEQA